MRKRLTARERKKIYDKTHGHCAYCGQPIALDEMQVDHVVPLRKGGADTMDNMLPSCRSCNQYKSTLTVEQFRAAVERMPEVLLRDSATFRIAERLGKVNVNRHPTIFFFERETEDDDR